MRIHTASHFSSSEAISKDHLPTGAKSHHHCRLTDSTLVRYQSTVVWLIIAETDVRLIVEAIIPVRSLDGLLLISVASIILDCHPDCPDQISNSGHQAVSIHDLSTPPCCSVSYCPGIVRLV